MEPKEFNKAIKAQQALCTNVLVSKGTEYATEDMLHNFKAAAHLRGCTLRQALAGMMVKHTVSVFDMCESSEDFPIEKWDEKITDHINYLLLLKAIVVNEKTTTP